MAERASRCEVTSIVTTAGDTLSKMSANDIGAPGGGAKMVAVDTWVTGSR